MIWASFLCWKKIEGVRDPRKSRAGFHKVKESMMMDDRYCDSRKVDWRALELVAALSQVSRGR